MLTAGTIRAATGLAVVKVIGDLGFDPVPVLATANWTAPMLEHPDKPVPFVALGRLVTAAVAATKCEHFGLLVGETAGTALMGPLGFAARHAPDVGAALRLAKRHLGIHDRGGVVHLSVQDGIVALGYRLVQPQVPGGDQIVDGALAVAFQLMQTLGGQGWHPQEVRLGRRRPADPRPYVVLFGNQVHFDAEDSSIIFPARWLDHRISGADPELERILLGVIEAMPQPPEQDFPDEVRRVMTGMLGSGEVRRDAIAQAFGISTSTLHRHLSERGTSHRELLDEVRFEMACRILSETKLPTGQVGIMLGYSEASAFTRSFKRRFGCGPAEWRSSHRAERSST